MCRLSTSQAHVDGKVPHLAQTLFLVAAVDIVDLITTPTALDAAKQILGDDSVQHVINLADGNGTIKIATRLLAIGYATLLMLLLLILSLLNDGNGVCDFKNSPKVVGHFAATRKWVVLDLIVTLPCAPSPALPPSFPAPIIARPISPPRTSASHKSLQCLRGEQPRARLHTGWLRSAGKPGSSTSRCA